MIRPRIKGDPKNTVPFKRKHESIREGIIPRATAIPLEAADDCVKKSRRIMLKSVWRVIPRRLNVLYIDKSLRGGGIVMVSLNEYLAIKRLLSDEKLRETISQPLARSTTGAPP